MERIEEILNGVKTLGIGGHVRPDGDCVGSCMALYLYIRKYFPQIKADIYLESPKPVFHYISHIEDIKTEADGDRQYDLFVTCDVSARDRLAIAGPYFDTAKRTACIDHHISNSGFAQVNHIRGEVSSACEVLYGLFDPEKVVRTIAVPIYTGMVHDTGVFQYSSTSPETMRIAGELMKTGFNFSKIIDESFYQKTYLQNQVMGRILAESIMLLDGRCIVGCMKKRDMDFYGVEGKDLDGNPVKSDELFSRNAVTVVNFWFTTCSPCVGELGELDALNKELAEKNGALIGVNSFTLDGNEAEISEAKDVLAKKGATYQNVYFDSDSEAGRFTTGIYAYPTTYVVDRNGNIVGDPIVGAITEKNQAETLQKLIDQAIASDTGENEE